MDPKFLQKGFDKRLSRVMEECGEVVGAAGKLQRFGPHSVNPYLKPEEQVENIDWLISEMNDLKHAISELEEAIQEEFGK